MIFLNLKNSRYFILYYCLPITVYDHNGLWVPILIYGFRPVPVRSVNTETRLVDILNLELTVKYVPVRKASWTERCNVLFLSACEGTCRKSTFTLEEYIRRGVSILGNFSTRSANARTSRKITEDTYDRGEYTYEE